MKSRALLAIDEGTTGTRAGLVDEHGSAVQVVHQPIDVQHPGPLMVEQDARQIWHRTLHVARQALATADGHGVEVVGVALAAQRATAVLWDAVTGEPFAPAMVWQDRRHAEELDALGDTWSNDLLMRTGRSPGSRSPFLWAAKMLTTQSQVREAYQGGRLRFGTIDAYLVWQLTGGRVHATGATQACASGGYLLCEHDWHRDWISALGFPVDLLPTLLEDDGDFGVTDADVLGAALPIRASVGDQHAARVALGCVNPDRGLCVHGTGSFLGTSTAYLPAAADPKNPGVLPLLGWRADGVSNYGVEAYCPTTGAALNWLCDTIGLFESPDQISSLASQGSFKDGAMFVPALAGLRTPYWEPDARASLIGLDLSTTRTDIAYAVLAGIAHSVCDADDGIAAMTGTRPRTWRFAGGLSTSMPLLQIQADLLGVPIERRDDAATASLRGAAYLAGRHFALWDDPTAADACHSSIDLVEPQVGAEERLERREQWLAHAVLQH